jgi:hypothetical protein
MFKLNLTDAEKIRIADCRMRTIKALGTLAAVALIIRLMMG